jgi:hypothetical protein
MGSVPLSMNQLEEITMQVSRELLEEWAINDRFTENEIEKATQNAVNDTVLIINSFMEKMNDAMIVQAENKKIIN